MAATPSLIKLRLLLNYELLSNYNRPIPVIMTSYAEIASHGPKQSSADRAAPSMPELVDHSTPTTALPHEDQSISVVESGYRDASIKTETQRLQHEKDDAAETLKRETKDKADRLNAKSRDILARSKSTALKVGKDARTYNLIDSVVLVAIGVAGYRRFREGTLELRSVSVGVLGLGLLATAQGFVQSWFKRQ